jgi:hypothetical protein
LPSFLTTKKMDPALVRRIEARIRGRRAEHGRSLAPFAVAALRLAALGIVIAVVTSFVLARQRERAELARARSSLIERMRSEAAALGEEDLQTRARVERLLQRFAETYAGDRVARELRAPGALEKTLKQPSIYIRGELKAFASPPAIQANAVESLKDPLLLCLVDPPPTPSELAQLRKVRTAYAGGDAVEGPTAHVRRLAELQVGLMVLSPEWQAKVEAAETHAAIDEIAKALDQAPIDAAKRAAKARLLLVAIDEPGSLQGPIELDGERPHPVRVALFEIATEKVLFRLRRTVDPKWIAPQYRPRYARGLDACALALDVRSSVSKNGAE